MTCRACLSRHLRSSGDALLHPSIIQRRTSSMPSSNIRIPSREPYYISSYISSFNTAKANTVLELAMDHSSLHQLIISSFLKTQRPPTVIEVATYFDTEENKARQGLRALAEYHGVVLHPTTDEIWVCHPFSASPTTCVVSSGDKKWWGNCAWCSLGVMKLAGGKSTLTTRLGAIGDEVSVTAKDGELLDKDFVIHFPIPMAKAWDNVIHTCSVQLLFRNEAEVDEWCAARGIAKGDIRPIGQIWDFSSEWYGRHADKDWKKWTLRDAVDIFSRHGLDGPTWSLGEENGRF